MTEEYQAKTLKPTRSAPVCFKGRIIAETQWDTPQGCWMRFTVWETQGGAYITEIAGDAPGKPDQVHCTVGIVEPIMYYPDPQKQEREAALAAGKIWAGEWPAKTPERDETAMQIAVLSAFDWHDRAKRMLKNELGWAPWIEVA